MTAFPGSVSIWLERATYLDYVQLAFIFDPVVVFVAKRKEFPFKGHDD